MGQKDNPWGTYHLKLVRLTCLTLSFLSCLAYGKQGMTAVTRLADAILQALIMMRSSINISFTSLHPLCTMYTSSPLTDSPISTLETDHRTNYIIMCILFKYQGHNYLSLSTFVCFYHIIYIIYIYILAVAMRTWAIRLGRQSKSLAFILCMLLFSDIWGVF